MIKRIINGITIVLSLLMFTSLCEAKTNTKGKFHLVYLVSAENLKVGAKVFVEPVLLSNGKKIIPLYDYCRATHKRAILGTKKIQKKKNAIRMYHISALAFYGSTEANIVRRFCLNKSFSVSAEHFSIIDNIGQRIRIGTVQFKANKKNLKLQEPPLLSITGTSTITKVGKISLDFLLAQESRLTGPHYFLMAANKSTLRNIVPVRVPLKKEITILLKKSEVLAKQNHGMTTKRCPKGECITRWHQETKRLSIVSYENIEVFFNSPLFADFNNDGAMDIAIHLQSSKPIKLNDYPHYWDALGFIFGDYTVTNGQILTKGQLQLPSNYFPYNHPLMYLKINSCAYFLTTGGYDGTDLLGIELLAFPVENIKCKDIHAYKVIPIF